MSLEFQLIEKITEEYIIIPKNLKTISLHEVEV